jgi:hypothetical protein
VATTQCPLCRVAVVEAEATTAEWYEWRVYCPSCRLTTVTYDVRGFAQMDWDILVCHKDRCQICSLPYGVHGPGGKCLFEPTTYAPKFFRWRTTDG